MKKRHSAPAADDEFALFLASVADVTPLPEHGRVVHRRNPPRPLPYQRMRDERAALAESLSDHVPWELAMESGEELTYVRPGLSRQVLKQLRRGHWVLQDQLDLHGLTSSEARALLVEFLNDCMRRGIRCVRLIHGKGLRSKNREPVLKRKVASWLAQRDEVLAFCQARSVDGGGGAAVVLLRSKW